jgi:tetratricopeptide (TPR) repeat protein
MKKLGKLFRLVLVGLVVVAMTMGASVARDTKKKNEYPNATRKEPKVQATQDGGAKLNKAFKFLDKEDDESAKALLQAIIDGKRSNAYEKALAYQGMSQIAYNADDIKTAIDFNQRAIDLDSLDNKAHFTLIYQQVQLNMMEEDYQKALAQTDQWLALSGAETADILALKGNALYRLEKFAEASEMIKRAISLTDKPQSSWYPLLIASYIDADNYPEAAKTAEQALGKDPDNKSLIRQLASVYIEMDQAPKALEVLEGAYKRGLLTEAAELKQLYQTYSFLDKPEQATKVIDEGVAKGILKPDYDMYRGLGNAYALQAQNIESEEETPEQKALWNKAVEAYTKASALAKDGEMDFLRGQLLIQEQEKYAEGKKAMQQAFARGGLKREGEAWILLGNAEYELGNKPAAIAAYQKAKTFPATKGMAESWLKTMKVR